MSVLTYRSDWARTCTVTHPSDVVALKSSVDLNDHDAMTMFHVKDNKLHVGFDSSFLNGVLIEGKRAYTLSTIQCRGVILGFQSPTPESEVGKRVSYDGTNFNTDGTGNHIGWVTGLAPNYGLKIRINTFMI